ncbi:hypothetical protein [Nocardioides sp.]|uniref:hypothetical protein n=1 Tax=Nocardioides sp. TaxID=35761 RepID=UPI0035160A96
MARHLLRPLAAALFLTFVAAIAGCSPSSSSSSATASPSGIVLAVTPSQAALTFADGTTGRATFGVADGATTIAVVVPSFPGSGSGAELVGVVSSPEVADLEVDLSADQQGWSGDVTLPAGSWELHLTLSFTDAGFVTTTDATTSFTLQESS